MRTLPLLAFALLAVAALLLAGCASPPSGEPDYRPSQPAPAKPTTPAQGVKAVQPPKNATPAQPVPEPVANTTPTAPPNASIDAPAPVQNQTVAEPCLDRAGDEAVQCLADKATAEKDVRVCARLADKTARFKCITMWCLSPGRDYRACDTLDEYDDQIGCRNKCNPNTNT